jgi:hypothetical protein
VPAVNVVHQRRDDVGHLGYAEVGPQFASAEQMVRERLLDHRDRLVVTRDPDVDQFLEDGAFRAERGVHGLRGDAGRSGNFCDRGRGVPLADEQVLGRGQNAQPGLACAHLAAAAVVAPPGRSGRHAGSVTGTGL